MKCGMTSVFRRGSMSVFVVNKNKMCHCTKPSAYVLIKYFTYMECNAL